MGQRVAILGGGGHAKVICSILRLTGYEVIGFLDDNPALHGAQLLGVPVLGPNELIATLGVDGAIVGIGDNAARREFFGRLQGLGIPIVNAIHPTAVIAEESTLGYGVAMMPNAVVNVSSRVGNNVVINTNGVVGHDCVIHDHVHIGPSSQVCGGVQVGEGTFVGASAVVIPYHTIGAGTVIGAGGVVTEDLPDRVLAVGVPARIVRRW